MRLDAVVYQEGLSELSCLLVANGASHLDFVLVVQYFEGFAVFDHFGALFEFELEQGVGDDSDSDVDSLDVVLDLRDGLLDILQGSVIAECLTSVVDFALVALQLVVDLGQLLF